MAHATRSGSPQKGKERQVPGAIHEELEPSPSPDPRQFYQEPSSGPPPSPSTLDLHANILALQQAQVNSQVKVQKQEQHLANMEKTLNGIMALLQTREGPSETVLPTRETSHEVRPSVGRPSVAPSSFSQSNPNYKPKARNPPRFDNNKGAIQYPAWKELILDKFEIDQEQFPTSRSLMSYVFNHTEGEAQEYIFPRYTRNADNVDLSTSYHEMLATLDTNYLNPHRVRDSKNAYKELKMGPTQAFQDFKTQFIQLANTGRIPLADRFDDMYDKLTTALQGQLLNQRHLLGEDFEKLCEVVLGIDVELKRLNVRRNKERENRLTTKPTTAKAPARNLVAKPPVLKDTSVGFSLLRRPFDAPNPSSALIKCFTCGEAGHMSKDCKRPKSTPTVNEIEEDEVAEFEATEDPADDSVDSGNDDA
jgi:Zinc knuckle